MSKLLEEVNKEFIFPDFTNSNLNISSSLAKYLNSYNDKPTIKLLDDELNKNYKNIVFICYDGLGINPININLDEDTLLKKNIKMELTSTFPSTTTNATTSLLSNKYPLEHGWFGWSLYFENIGKNVDIFKDTESSTGIKLEISNKPIKKQDYYFDNTNTDYEINTVLPKYVEVKNEKNNHVFETIDDFYNNIHTILNRSNKQFIYAYMGEPDTTMHEYGVTSNEAKTLINKINDKTEELFNKTNNTLFIITADHGQIDIEGYVDFYNDKKLMDMLKIYPYLDARAVAFKLKDGYNLEFEKYFNEKYNEDFILYKSKDLIKKGVFGKKGNMGDLLGDYIAIGTYTNKTAIMTPISHKFKGHHTSLTDEMLVPLILFNN